MAQYNNQHLTIAQLSAYVDEQLVPDELALCDAHMQICHSCQSTLADLQLTSALLRGMPQVEVPRSFVLPINMLVLPETPARVEPRQIQSGGSLSILRRSLRALSTLAAVIGLVFILAGLVAALPHGGNSATATSSAAFPASGGVSSQAEPGPTSNIFGSGGQTTQAPTNEKTPAGTPLTPGSTSGTVAQQPGPSPTLDLGEPSGRLEVGSAIFLLGVLGLFASRRFSKALPGADLL